MFNSAIRTALVPALFLLASGSQAAGLSGPYTDPSYFTKVPWFSHSHWLQPWRAYMETVPASVFVNGCGVHVDYGNDHMTGVDADMACKMMARGGVATVRLELSWDHILWEDESKVAPDIAERLGPWLKACKKYGIRPMMAANSHHGIPCPTRRFERVVKTAASAGAREVKLEDASGIVPGRSGLSDFSEFWSAECMITAVKDNTVTLGKPIPKPLAAGAKAKVAVLKFKPFSAPGSPDAAETLAAWQRYIGTIAAFATDALGTKANKKDKGFDLELWNELSFGSHFLGINFYYDPPLVKYNGDEIWAVIVASTVDYVNKHAAAFAGVQISDGFSNTVPWPASSKEPDRVAAISKHPYPPEKNYPKDEQGGHKINALGQEDQYVPTYNEYFPEYFGTALQTETMVRDMGPFDADIQGGIHGRYARKSAPVAVWMTEVGTPPNEHGIKDPAKAIVLRGKSTSRFLAFYLNKGVKKIHLYAAAEYDSTYGVLLDKFIDYAKKTKEYPKDEKAYTSDSLQIMGRMSAKMKEQMDPKLVQTRPLKVESISDTHDHFQFSGDGTPAHPNLYNREVFCFLPYQANAKRFVIPYYVMTRRFMENMAPEQYSVKISGVKGTGAAVSAYDPILDKEVPVKVENQDANSLTLNLTTADYPYMLVVQEK